MTTIDCRCACDKCEARTGDIYRMVGICVNCGAKDLLMLFRAGDETRNADCPVCGCWSKVQSQRLATADEIPAALPSAPDPPSPAQET
jgi:ssDNA-binding Zn-finger/Zn-ribbon topoisomerase 1